MALAAAPDRRRTVFGGIGDAGVRLDVALVNRLGGELVLDDSVGFGETGVGVAELELKTLGDVGSRLGLRIDAFGKDVIV